MRLAEVFKDIDSMPQEQAILLIGQALPPAVAHRYYAATIDARRESRIPITHRTSTSGHQTDEYRVYMGRRYRAADCIRNQIVYGRLVRTTEDGVKVLHVTEAGRVAIGYWLAGQVAPRRRDAA